MEKARLGYGWVHCDEPKILTFGYGFCIVAVASCRVLKTVCYYFGQSFVVHFTPFHPKYMQVTEP